jgi:hypothetical protein
MQWHFMNSMCEVIHGESYGQAIKAVPLSNNTVMRRTDSVSKDIKEHGLNAVRNLHFKPTNQKMLQV